MSRWLFALGLILCTFTVRADLAEQLFKEALHVLGGNANAASKWQSEIRFGVIQDEAEESLEASAREIVSEAAELAGVPLVFPSRKINTGDYILQAEQIKQRRFDVSCSEIDAACFNFFVVITGPEQMSQLATAIPLREVYSLALRDSPELACFFAPHARGGLSITGSVVYVNKDLERALLETCLREEIYQSFGLFNDVSGSSLFSFNNVVAPKQITDYDKALLQALYDPRVKPGYPVNFVVRIFLENLGLQ